MSDWCPQCGHPWDAHGPEGCTVPYCSCRQQWYWAGRTFPELFQAAWRTVRIWYPRGDRLFKFLFWFALAALFILACIGLTTFHPGW